MVKNHVWEKYEGTEVTHTHSWQQHKMDVWSDSRSGPLIF
jgi:hypothetical protein